MKDIPITLPNGAVGYASADDVSAAVWQLLVDPAADESTSAGRDGGARRALNEDYVQSIVQAIVDRAAARGIVARQTGVVRDAPPGGVPRKDAEAAGA